MGAGDKTPVAPVHRSAHLIGGDAVKIEGIVGEQEVSPAAFFGSLQVIDGTGRARLQDGRAAVPGTEDFRSRPGFSAVGTHGPDRVADGGAHHGEQPSVRQPHDAGFLGFLPLPRRIGDVGFHLRSIERILAGIEKRDADVAHGGVLVDILVLPEFHAGDVAAVVPGATGQVTSVGTETQGPLPHAPDGRNGRVSRIGGKADGEGHRFGLGPREPAVVRITALHNAAEVFFDRGLLVPQAVETAAPGQHGLLPGCYRTRVGQGRGSGQDHRFGPGLSAVCTPREHHVLVIRRFERSLGPESIQEAASRVFQHMEMVVERIAHGVAVPFGFHGRLFGNVNGIVVRNHMLVDAGVQVVPVKMVGPAFAIVSHV